MEALQITADQPRPLNGAPVLEESLLLAAAQGDAQAFETIVATYEARLQRQCMRRGLSKDEAADVTQDVFIKVYRNLDRYSHQNTFGTWLYRVTENACIDYCRQRARRAAVILPMPTDDEGHAYEQPGQIADPEAQLQADRLGRRIAAALQGLSPMLREAFELKELEGLRYEQIATRLGVTEGTVKSRIFRARRILTTQLQDLI